MTILFANNALTTLASGIGPSSTSLTVAAGTGSAFPSPTGADYFVLTLQDSANADLTEIVHCTSRSGDTLTVVRAQEGTLGQSWTSGDFAFTGPTAGTMEAFAQIPVVNAYLNEMPPETVKANLSGISAVPDDVTLADLADALPLATAAFVSFQGRSSNGACTILAQQNVSGVNRNGAGNYTVSFTTPIPTDYLPLPACTGRNVTVCQYPEAAQLAGSCQFWIQLGQANTGSGPQDPDRVFIQFLA